MLLNIRNVFFCWQTVFFLQFDGLYKQRMDINAVNDLSSNMQWLNETHTYIYFSAYIYIRFKLALYCMCSYFRIWMCALALVHGGTWEQFLYVEERPCGFELKFGFLLRQISPKNASIIKNISNIFLKVILPGEFCVPADNRSKLYYEIKKSVIF